MHLEYEVKKVCFGRKVLGRLTPNPRAGCSSGNSCLVLVAEALESAMRSCQEAALGSQGSVCRYHRGCVLRGGDGGLFLALVLTPYMSAASHPLSCYNTGSCSAGTAHGDPHPDFGLLHPPGSGVHSLATSLLLPGRGHSHSWQS